MKNTVNVFIFLSQVLLLSTACQNEQTKAPKISKDLTCEEATNETNAYPAYMSVQYALKKGKNLEEISYLRCFLPEEKVGQSTEKTLENFTRLVLIQTYFMAIWKKNMKRSYYKILNWGEQGLVALRG